MDETFEILKETIEKAFLSISFPSEAQVSKNELSKIGSKILK